MRLLALGLLLTATTAEASPWVKYIDCGNGAVVLDQHVPDRPTGILQLVVRDQREVQSLLQAEAIPRSRLNARGELIISFQLKPSELPKFVYEGLGDAYQDDGTGVVYFLRSKGSQLELQSFPTTQPDRRAPVVVGQTPIGTWTFNSCQFR